MTHCRTNSCCERSQVASICATPAAVRREERTEMRNSSKRSSICSGDKMVFDFIYCPDGVQNLFWTIEYTEHRHKLNGK
ncbi:hypothetical protein THIOM_002106 [Candidatus Thiomargarita nelsonii]|uniref:Uncharacterized protein n=1 Tax=Candidatus Thiomargarita nelsonii TaxID=1003181 RepID=A0A176S2H5_9GAMM|nr:hypothetical protein THIOM_002106 [Candidatus Thiomargarita nelsonii]